jgi:ferredoxin
MATVITEECINCGACESECPNVAIYQGDVEYEFGGAMSAALSTDFFYIVPEKCTECVGFFDEEACAVVCPVDCCVPDPARPESEGALLERAKELHADKTFGDDFPSRFKAGGAESPADAPAVAAAPAAPIAAAPAAPVAVAEAVGPSIQDFDVPILCKGCQGEYEVGYRFLAPGTVLRCPHCSVSFSPTQQMFVLVTKRLQSYADEMNVEIDRYTELVERERARLDVAATKVQRAVRGELRSITTPLTERPKRSMFG